MEKQTITEREAVDKLNTLLQENLGACWGVCGLGVKCIKVGLIDDEKPKDEYGLYSEITAHRFDVYVDNHFGVRINYGTLGSFDPSKDLERVIFLQGLATFSSDCSLQEEVKNTLLALYAKQ